MSTATHIPRSAPPAPAFPLLLRLVGEPFLFAHQSYGDELVLHFGERKADPERVIKGREFRYEYGTYSLHVRGSSWVVKSAIATERDLYHTSTLPPGALDVAVEGSITPGARVTAAFPFPVDRPDVTGYGLRVELSDGATVVIIPTANDGPETAPDGTPLPPLADWELHTPYGNLVIGPGREIHVRHRGVTLTDGSKFTWIFPAFIPMRSGGGDQYAPEPVWYPPNARSVPIYTDEDNARRGIATLEMEDLVPVRVDDEAMLQRVIAHFEQAGATHLAIDICTNPGRPGGFIVPIAVALGRTAVGE